MDINKRMDNWNLKAQAKKRLQRKISKMIQKRDEKRENDYLMNSKPYWRVKYHRSEKYKEEKKEQR